MARINRADPRAPKDLQDVLKSLFPRREFWEVVMADAIAVSTKIKR